MPRCDTKERIMHAAEKLFTSRRFHEITLDDIVKEAGIGKGTVYLHFKDKDDLFFQVAVSGFDELCGLLQNQVLADASVREQLLQAVTAIASFFRRRKQLFRMIQTEEARMPFFHGRMREEWNRKRYALVDSLGKIILKGQSEGLIRGDFAPETLASFLLGFLRTRGRNLDSDGEKIGDELLLDLFLCGATQNGSGIQLTRAQGSSGGGKTT